jgi:hypothetical protein
MAYYTSTNKSELEAYNTLVVNGEGYDGVYTTDWATIIEHPNGSDYAILKHDSYTAELTEEETLGSEWFPQNDIE